MIAPARLAAFAALTAHEDKGAHLPAAIAAARTALTDPRDQGLLTELATGTVRMRKALDYQLAQRTSRALDAVDPPVLRALRLGAFQLLYVDRLPPSAIVNDAVALTRRAGKTSAGAMVNAVLRALARDRGGISWPEGPAAAALATRHSHPEWLVERWLARYGLGATEAWLTFDNRPPRLCLAVNRLKGTREELAARLAADGVATEPTATAPEGLHVIDGAALATDSFRQGWFAVQDEASQLIAQLGTMPAGGRVLDLCASPGGKTMTLAARSPSNVLVACDVRPRRIRLLRQTLARLEVRAAIAQVAADGDLPFAAGSFDYVLVDAPCSGLGTLRRDPDIRWSRTAADFARFSSAQLALLNRAARLVTPGGTLVYATCSSEPEENEVVVAGFLAGAPGFTAHHLHRTTPFEAGLEAFFGAVLVRNV